ncbi:MAG: hypothetical protein ACI9S8_000438 [Chlamydiales bacterium]|jgi:hypothetical protein
MEILQLSTTVIRSNVNSEANNRPSEAFHRALAIAKFSVYGKVVDTYRFIRLYIKEI